MAFSTGSVDSALLTRIRTATGRPIGDAAVPSDTTKPYGILYPLPGGTRDGSVADPHDDATLTYQLTCVGERREQARWLADRAQTDLLHGTTLAVAGAQVTFIELEVNPGVERDDSTGSPALYYCTPRFVLSLTS